jgi:hypothetical protein
VSGRVFDTRGDVLSGAKVEIWQANHQGLYDIDGYSYRATLLADRGGKYDFGSLMPGHYPGRVCQHIHYLVSAPRHKPLITQLYFATDPVFEGDPADNFARDPLIQNSELVRPVMLAREPNDVHALVTGPGAPVNCIRRFAWAMLAMSPVALLAESPEHGSQIIKLSADLRSFGASAAASRAAAVTTDKNLTVWDLASSKHLHSRPMQDCLRQQMRTPRFAYMTRTPAD